MATFFNTASQARTHYELQLNPVIQKKIKYVLELQDGRFLLCGVNHEALNAALETKPVEGIDRAVDTVVDFDLEMAKAQRRWIEKNVPGLKELEACIDDQARYQREFHAMMADEYNDGVNPPKSAQGGLGALKVKYPVAAAYIKAQNWSYASHYVKAGAGREAMEKIGDGLDYKDALEAMEKEWGDDCRENMWN